MFLFVINIFSIHPLCTLSDEVVFLEYTFLRLGFITESNVIRSLFRSFYAVLCQYGVDRKHKYGSEVVTLLLVTGSKEFTFVSRQTQI
jgi:hypothetical protein